MQIANESEDVVMTVDAENVTTATLEDVEKADTRMTVEGDANGGGGGEEEQVVGQWLVQVFE
jgi:hypothetical protein